MCCLIIGARWKRVVDVGAALGRGQHLREELRVRAALVQVVLAGPHVGERRWSHRPARWRGSRSRRPRRAGCRCPSAGGRPRPRGTPGGRGRRTTLGLLGAGCRARPGRTCRRRCPGRGPRRPPLRDVGSDDGHVLDQCLQGGHADPSSGVASCELRSAGAAGQVVRGQVGEAERGQQPVAREVAGGAVAGDALGRAAGGVEPGRSASRPGARTRACSSTTRPPWVWKRAGTTSHRGERRRSGRLEERPAEPVLALTAARACAAGGQLLGQGVGGQADRRGECPRRRRPRPARRPRRSAGSR